MREGQFLFTSESVGEGHPDKLCDQVSDAVLDEALKQDPNSRVACEVMATFGKLIVAGEITTRAKIDYERIARDVIRDIGYDDENNAFNSETCIVQTEIHQQSPDIAMGVDRGGAGDQGMMFGYATNETKELMPLPITLAHKLVRELANLRKKKKITYLKPDCKSQVTVAYKDGIPQKITAIVISTQHSAETPLSKIEKDIRSIVIPRVIPAKYLDSKTKIYVNPTGRFEVGGPEGDTGLTGRKLIVDTYGGVGAHGGGAFSGKDPSKVDRSASYFARYLAKNVVASGAARRCEIQIAYAIGVAEPVSVMINTFGTGKVQDEEILKVLRGLVDFTPLGIIRTLKLRRPVYKATAAYGHFGRREAGFTWEETNLAGKIRKKLLSKSSGKSSKRRPQLSLV